MLFTELEKEAVDKLVNDLTQRLMGETIVSIEQIDYDNFLFTVGKGVTFNVIGVGECCASAEIVDFERILKTDNVITSVKLVENDKFGGGKRFNIFLLSEMEELYSVAGQVSEGSGEYSFGWELIVSL